jgi:hypothetical protein
MPTTTTSTSKITSFWCVIMYLIFNVCIYVNLSVPKWLISLNIICRLVNHFHSPRSSLFPLVVTAHQSVSWCSWPLWQGLTPSLSSLRIHPYLYQVKPLIICEVCFLETNSRFNVSHLSGHRARSQCSHCWCSISTTQKQLAWCLLRSHVYCLYRRLFYKCVLLCLACRYLNNYVGKHSCSLKQLPVPVMSALWRASRVNVNPPCAGYPPSVSYVLSNAIFVWSIS